MNQDLQHYSIRYYERNIPENVYPRNGLLRPDQLAALAYAHGWPFHGRESYAERHPGKILSVGCGRGDLEALLETMGLEVVGVDPSKGAEALYRGKTLLPAIPDDVSDFGTVLFVESLEHIPEGIVEPLLERLQRGTRVVVTNWLDTHPLRPHKAGWDHITLVDDDLFSRLSAGFNVWVKRGSHLVMDKR